MSNGEGVTYTVKELISMLESKLVEQLGGITRRLDQIDGKLDEKASNHRVRDIEESLERHKEMVDLRFRPLELALAGGVAVSKWQWAAAGLFVMGLGAVATLVWLAAGH